MSFSPIKQNFSRIVGLDLSTNSIAYSLFVDGELLEFGELIMKGEPHYRNYQANRYGNALRKRLKPDLICYESAVYINNKKTVIALAEAAGSVVSSMSSAKTEIRKLIPIEWQNFIGNKALTKAEKEQLAKQHPGKSKTWYKNIEREFRKQRTMEWANDTFSISVVSDNVSDAIAVGYTAVNKKV